MKNSVISYQMFGFIEPYSELEHCFSYIIHNEIALLVTSTSPDLYLRSCLTTQIHSFTVRRRKTLTLVIVALKMCSVVVSDFMNYAWM